MNNEQVGISVEIAIADFFGVQISQQYRSRGIGVISKSITPLINNIFQENQIPAPVRHVAENQSKIDFILRENKTLSVKTNKQGLGKVAPQRIGQASSKTWFNYFGTVLNVRNVPDSYSDRVKMFKQIVLSKPNISVLLSEYWKNLFDCDYFIHVYNIVEENGIPTGNANYVVLKKMECPTWDIGKISFTKPTMLQWHESNSVKYDNITIGEFQIHNNRDNFKFRFNIAGLIKADLI